MSGLLHTVNQRTQLVGQNRMELLVFKLDKESQQNYAINVFKIREAQPCPKLTHVPDMHHTVRGIAHIRDQNIAVIDLSAAAGGKPITDLSESVVIITEYNSSVQGFLVDSVDRIINMNWESILPPPSGLGQDNYLTSVAQLGDELVNIIDVEKILSETCPTNVDIAEVVAQKELPKDLEDKFIFIADDSSVARLQLRKTINEIGIDVVEAFNGADALKQLQEIAENPELHEKLLMVISDIEMPKMDGYTLCSRIKSSEAMKDTYVMLHSSLSGMCDESLLDKVGANDFIPKFAPDVLTDAIIAGIHYKNDRKK